ncbi:uncharacterized protein LOC144449572 [Glandiceps talaboti]
MTAEIALRYHFASFFWDMMFLSGKAEDLEYGGRYKLLRDPWEEWPRHRRISDRHNMADHDCSVTSRQTGRQNGAENQQEHFNLVNEQEQVNTRLVATNATLGITSTSPRPCLNSTSSMSHSRPDIDHSCDPMVSWKRGCSSADSEINVVTNRGSHVNYGSMDSV